MSFVSQDPFSFIHQNFLLFNTCWEDPRLDRQALALSSKDTVAVITSAGCNALDYLLDDPAHVHAVDVNPLQNHLLELKVAAIRELDYATFFDMFGLGKVVGFKALYQRHLKPHLSSEAQCFWDTRTGYFEGSFLFPTFYYRGATGLAATIARNYIRFRGIDRATVEAVFAANSIEEQVQIYDRDIRPRIWSNLLRKAMDWDWVLALLGYHGAQKEQVQREYGGMTAYVDRILEHVFTQVPLKDNYFWRLYVFGSYTPDCCPEYLREDNFNSLKGGLVDRLSVHSNTMADFLRESDKKISRFVLLDHMDWLSRHNNPGLIDEWTQILANRADDTKILWRSTAKTCEFIDDLQLPGDKESFRLGEVLAYNQSLANELHARDRVGIYESFYVANVNR
tara:strand:- start:1276 stop:2460 length:1185 start_codon:yes stop_codon:yes gene_type:complete